MFFQGAKLIQQKLLRFALLISGVCGFSTRYHGKEGVLISRFLRGEAGSTEASRSLDIDFNSSH